MKKILYVFLMLILSGVSQELNGQVLHGKTQKESARTYIESLHKGVLIVPLFVQNNKIDALKEMISSNDLKEKSRKKLVDRLEKELLSQDSFNFAVVRHFRSAYDFSRVLFIEDHQLHDFDPGKTIFINPDNFLPDDRIRLDTENYFFIKYYKTAGVATDPESVRFFYITNQDLELIEKPFPNSPGRKKSFSLRFRDLLNISPNTNEMVQTLVMKLNDNLHRYYKR